MVEDGSLRVLKILSHASAVIAEGEVEQLTTQRRIETDEEQYLKIISAKTAALFAAACRIAPVVAEAGDEAEIALENYGRYLGIAFQLVDDAIDYGSDADVMGKGVGDDFRDGKITLPVILAYARGSRRRSRLLARRDQRRAHVRRRPGPRDRLAPQRRRAGRHGRACTPSTAGARSMRWRPSPPARPSRRLPRQSSSRSPALTEVVLDRRTVLQGLGGSAAALALSGCVTPAQTRKARPNIVFIMTDDHAQSALSSYGNTILKTPNLDRIGEEGVRFTEAFVTNSLCLPSRATYLTGFIPTRTA